ncbi:paired immunoglobulin-like type 2 receptor beta isoform X2 [Microcaecilia unicolor]|uniref:paired immunoglobulin-like type 2 receptor beta isoform X2 n=1 Tax=Microcaecilia unicolor TaxID=1415580 RepID=UPI0011871F0D|nr:paired immunoglobulin-like type 2 receptor beta isoform X2 [Microcaecilia unicolor]
MAALLVLTVMFLCCTSDVSAQHPRFDVFQPESVSAVVGGSVTLPCSFSYPRDFGPTQNVNVYWRINNFHGGYIYRHTEKFTHQDYRGRIFLDGDPLRKNTASIKITDLRKEDSERYFCRVEVIGSGGRTEVWQNISGTALSVAVSTSTTIQTSTQTTSVATQTWREPIDRDQGSGKPSIFLIIGVVAGTLLLICIIGTTCFVLRRNRGQRQAGKDTKEGSQNEAAQPEMYENIRKGVSGQPAQSSPESQEKVESDGGLIYSSLNHKISNTARKEAPRVSPSEEGTVYAAVRHGV